jgi:hypothetical protein
MVFIAYWWVMFFTNRPVKRQQTKIITQYGIMFFSALNSKLVRGMIVPNPPIRRGHVRALLLLGQGRTHTCWAWTRPRPTPCWGRASPRLTPCWAWTRPRPTPCWGRARPHPAPVGQEHPWAQLHVGSGRDRARPPVEPGSLPRPTPC